ncbi:MAG TPA: hypothetical protein VEU62_08790, partial [Bryobacterales bacterium]|nr:hypothetical protein [Bryobacterales bacterium]
FRDVPIRFFLEDVSAERSAAEKALQRFPALADLALAAPGARNWARPAQMAGLSNFDKSWDAENPRAAGKQPSLEVLRELFAGVPEEFSFGGGSVIWGPVGWIDGIAPAEAPRRPDAGRTPYSARFPTMTYLASSVLLQRTGAGGLRLMVIAQWPEAAAEDEPVDSISAGLALVLALLGPAEREQRLQVPEPPPGDTPGAAEPASRGELDKIHQRHRSKLNETIAALSLPHHLLPAREILFGPREPRGQIKAVMAAACGPGGWQVSLVKDRGLYQLSKKTRHGRSLLLNFDVTPMTRDIVCFLVLVTEKGSFRLHVPPRAGPDLGQYPVHTKALLKQVLENLAAIVSRLEATWCEDLDQALGAPPAP